MTLFFRNTSNNDLVAIVFGIHPGTLMSRFFWAALWLNTSSNLFTKSSYWVFSTFNNLFFSPTCLYSSLIWCLRLLILLSCRPFSSSSSRFLARSLLSVWLLIRALYSASFASQRASASLASLLRSFSVCSRCAILSLLLAISASLLAIIFLSSAIRLSFWAPSCSRPLMVDSSC